MATTPTSAGVPQDRPEFASRTVLTVHGVPAEDTATLGFWIQAYLTATVHGVRSPEVAGTIARHLGRFHDWMTAGFGHDRVHGGHRPRGHRVARAPHHH
ncbi:hypothetical protein GCM10010174_60920 [Kutzneria viridogrisea]|uniref:Uncharacterized protein n=1 Tax=Kutzneria viridogrisea TaxID=47990 RepID=A0ABR6BY68_9PSEU|nr:hypothetical protein [Kutzneria viridogrisea]